MREMKDSGIEWIPRIPSDWTTIRLKNCFTNGKGLPITKENLIESGLPVISYGQIHAKNNSGTDTDDSLLRYVDYRYQTRYPQCEVFQYDFVFADTSEDYDGCGNCVYKRDNTPLFAGYHSIILHSSYKRDNRYFAYLFKTDAWRKQLRETVSGVKVFSITQKMLMNCSVIVPPFLEQQQISDYLDAKCAEIDALTADIQAQIDTLEQYKRSVITDAVTKGLNPDVEMKDSGIEWIGETPVYWDVVKIKYLTKERNNSGLMNPQIDRYIGLENVEGYSNSLVETESEYVESWQKKCYQGDIMFSRLRPYLAKVIISPFNGFSTGEFLQLYKYKGDIRYLRYGMLAPAFIDAINMSTYGAKMPRANTEFIVNMLIPQPPTKEQQQIADYLDTKCAEVDGIIDQKKEQLATLENYKKSLIFEYVTGKKEVPIA